LPGHSYDNVVGALGAVNTNITNINNNIDNLTTAAAGGLAADDQQNQGLKREAWQGIAMAAAIAHASMRYEPGRTGWRFNNAV